MKPNLFRGVVVLALFLTACGAREASPGPVPLPSPVQTWSAVLTQTGGFIGVDLTVEVTSDGQLTARDQRTGQEATQQLSPVNMARLARLISTTAASPGGVQESGCADCYLYELQIQTNGRIYYTRSDDTTLQNSDARTLINLLQDLRDKALKQ